MTTFATLAIGWGLFWLVIWGVLLAGFLFLDHDEKTDRSTADAICFVGTLAACAWIIAWAFVWSMSP